MAESVRILLSEEEVDKRIKELGEAISRDYAGETVHLVCVLKGGVFFMCELAKRITVPVTMDFMSASSYGSSTKSSGVVKIVKDLDEPLKDRHVLIVEDIIDTGLETLNQVSGIFHILKRLHLGICLIGIIPESGCLHFSLKFFYLL